VLLPLPMPPVRPMRRPLIGRSSPAPGPARPASRPDRRRPEGPKGT
jgi:hypothetical protein